VNTPAPPSPPVAAVKLTVDATGVYEVPAEVLRGLGFDLAHIDPTTLRLSTGGQAVPFMLVGEGQSRALRFYGETLGPAAYTNRNVYWLERHAPGGPQISGRPVNIPGDMALTGVVSATIHAEEQHQYVPKVGPGTDPWLWQSVFAPGEITVSVTTPHVVPGPSGLRLRIWGNSSAPAAPDHHLLLWLNGTRVADEAWDGLGEHLITATVPAGVLLSGENKLRLRAPGDTGAPADAVLLDWVEITYPQELAIEAGMLAFNGQAAGFTVRTPDDPAVVWDITTPDQPVALTGYAVDRGRVRFASDGTPRRFILATPAGIRRPESLAVATGPDLHAWPGGADMIILTVPQFRAALQPLVAARQAAGLRVAVVDVATVYDTFNHGRADPAAIRTFVQDARAHWTPPAPRFLLLAGDASHDPRHYLGGPEADLVPTHLVDTAFTGRTASDVWYALPDASASARPALAVGRFPAQTAAQLAAMVAKTLAYEQSDPTAAWRSRAFFLADNDEPGFAIEAQAFAAAIPHYTSSLVTINGDGAQARVELRRALDEGVGLLGYFGHGSLTLWAQEQVFGVSEVPKLTNRDRWPIVFTVTCLSGYFTHPVTPSLGEALLRAPDSGAVAALVPSSAAVLDDQRVLATALAQALSANPETRLTLGEVIWQAQLNLPDGSHGIQEILLTFNLLGDPTLQVHSGRFSAHY